MKNVTDSWKNAEVFNRQLELNKDQLQSNYPSHWNEFLRLMLMFKPKSILDVGCGCGAYYKLCAKHLPSMFYVGIDYSKEAIELAIKTWNYESFFVLDYKDLTSEYIENFEVIHMGALLDVLPNGDEALDFILSLSPKSLLLGRVKLIEEESSNYIYRAYDTIETYSYSHNKNVFLNLCKLYNYKVYVRSDSFYLTK